MAAAFNNYFMENDMTAYKKNYIDTDAQHCGPDGTLTTLPFKMTTTSGGIVENSNATVALGSGDTVKLGVLPAGMTLLTALMLVSDAFTASSTAAIGFAYCDGVDVTGAAAQDADYFIAALALDSASRTAASNTAVIPVTLPKDAYLVLTHSAHTQAVVGRLDVLVQGIMTGTP